MRSLFVILAVFPTCALSETLAELRGTVEGREVSIAGSIGLGPDFIDSEAINFRDEEGNFYPVTFDAGRDARKSLEGCKFELIGSGTPCRMTGMAEIEFDGPRIKLIIYQVDEISPPGG